MKKLLLIVITLVFAGVFACKKDDNSVIKPVSLDQPFILELNQTAELKSDQMRIKFLGISEDSRCPTGANCFWEGRAVADFEVSQGDEYYMKTLTDNPGNDPTLSTWFAAFGHYVVLQSVTPYPDGNPISQREYVVKLVIQDTSPDAN